MTTEVSIIFVQTDRKPNGESFLCIKNVASNLKITNTQASRIKKQLGLKYDHTKINNLSKIEVYK